MPISRTSLTAEVAIRNDSDSTPQILLKAGRIRVPMTTTEAKRFANDLIEMAEAAEIYSVMASTFAHAPGVKNPAKEKARFICGIQKQVEKRKGRCHPRN